MYTSLYKIPLLISNDNNRIDNNKDVSLRVHFLFVKRKCSIKKYTSFTFFIFFKKLLKIKKQ